VNKYLASPIAIQTSIVSNFILNNYWTFRWRKTADSIRVRGVKFNLVSLAALGISYTAFILLSVAFPRVHPALIQFLGIIPATMINYLGNSYGPSKIPRCRNDSGDWVCVYGAGFAYT